MKKNIETHRADVPAKVDFYSEVKMASEILTCLGLGEDEKNSFWETENSSLVENSIFLDSLSQEERSKKRDRIYSLLQIKISLDVLFGENSNQMQKKWLKNTNLITNRSAHELLISSDINDILLLREYFNSIVDLGKIE